MEEPGKAVKDWSDMDRRLRRGAARMAVAALEAGTDKSDADGRFRIGADGFGWVWRGHAVLMRRGAAR